MGLTSVHFGPGKADPDDLGALRRYFTELYDMLGIERNSVGADIEKARASLDFVRITEGKLTDPVTGQRDPATAFRMIEDESTALVVEYGSEAERAEFRRLLKSIRASTAPDRDNLRALEPYTARLHRRLAASPEVAIKCRPVVGSLVEWMGDYDELLGIVPDIPREDYLL